MQFLRFTHDRPPPGFALLTCLGLLALLVAACGDEPTGNTLPDSCGNTCLLGFEDCVEGTCVTIGGSDSGNDTADAGDVSGDSDDDAEGDQDLPDCFADSECDTGEFCSDDGDCLSGCRVLPDNCTDCTLFPETCNDNLACNPFTHACVSGCVGDDECEPEQFCNLENSLCETGCRSEPDNCPVIPGETIFCDVVNHRCTDGPCSDDSDCLSGFFCDDDVCIQGCRTDPDTCGPGETCDELTRLCEAASCTCDEGDANETCDAFCNDEGGITPYFCDRGTQTCQFGCRVRDDDSDTCRVGTICDEASHTCVSGCLFDESCPFGTYCDLDLESCVAGCKPGECDKVEFCDLDTRLCSSQVCDEDEDCPDGTFCDPENNVCVDGCRLDPDSCVDPLICDPESRQCILEGCDSHSDCPLRQICIDEVCVPGCDGLDERCPDGEPCSEITLFCGCIADSDCPLGTHCSSPVCEPDCIADAPLTLENEDSCPSPLMCDPATGRCTGSCPDSAENAVRNDTPDDATCAMFTLNDLTDGNQLALCTHGEASPPDTYCADEVGSWCTTAVACTGGDFDWYTMYLYAGESVSFAASYANPGSTTFVLELSSATNPAARIRGAVANGTGVSATDVPITETNQYFVRAFAVSDARVLYDIEIRVDRFFECVGDGMEPNNALNQTDPEVPTIDNTEALQSFELTMCTADRDYFKMDLFAGQQLVVTVDPDDADETLDLVGGQSDGEAVPDIDTGAGTYMPAVLNTDTGDLNDVIIDRNLTSTGTYFVRIQSPDGLGETDYSMTVQSGRGAAVCRSGNPLVDRLIDPYEDNDEPGNLVVWADLGSTNRLRIPDDFGGSFGQVDFDDAVLCPDEGDGADVDYFRIELGVEADDTGFLTVNLVQESDAAQVELFTYDEDEETLAPVALAGGSDANSQIASANKLAALPSGQYYVVRVSQDTSGDPIPFFGTDYDLLIDFAAAFCPDDPREQNDSLESAYRLHDSVLAASGACGATFSDHCDEDGVECLCLNTTNLTSCPSDEDWYLMQMLVQDIFSVRILPTTPITSNDLRVRLYPESGEIGDALLGDSRCDGGSCAVEETITDIVVQGPSNNGVVAEPQSGIIATYYVSVTSTTGEPIDYELLVEVDAATRECTPDDWDEPDFELYDPMGGNEVACGVSSCTLTDDASATTGTLCYWDERDWFSFTANGTDSVRVLVQFSDLFGTVRGLVYADSGGFPQGSPLGTLRDRATIPSGIQPGIDLVFNGTDDGGEALSAGVYHLNVQRSGDDRPNDNYTVQVSTSHCGDGTLSHGEDCDATSIEGFTTCSGGGACPGDCVCP